MSLSGYDGQCVHMVVVGPLIHLLMGGHFECQRRLKCMYCLDNVKVDGDNGFQGI